MSAFPILVKASASRADPDTMRSVMGLCICLGSLMGSFLPALWGDSGFSLIAVATTALGGVAGLWVGLRVES